MDQILQWLIICLILKIALREIVDNIELSNHCTNHLKIFKIINFKLLHILFIIFRHQYFRESSWLFQLFKMSRYLPQTFRDQINSFQSSVKKTNNIFILQNYLIGVMFQLRTAILTVIVQYVLSQALYNHGTSSNVNSSWMGLLDNGIPIRQMSIIGSHSSMSQGIWGDAFQTQGNSLMGQMVMGMRALDIRCNHKNNAFPIHDRMVYLNIDLGGVLTTVRSFLQAHPTQTILMHIVQEYSASGNSRTFQQTFISYKNNFLDIIWIPTSQDPVLGEVRGKVVIIQDFSGTSIHGLLYSTFTVLPHMWMTTNWNQYDKWTAVKTFLATTNAAGASRLSFWTGHGGSMPYFVASGKSSPSNGAGRLVTGATTPGWPSSYCPDFPRVSCFIGICSIVFQGINILGYNYIVSQNFKYLGIIFTDFMGDQLLNKVISVNTGKFAPCPSNLLTQGCTYCSNTGLCLGCNTTVNYVYSPNTCTAKSGFYLNWTDLTTNSVIACNIPMIGCLTCSSGTVCTQCDTFSNYQLVNGSCQAAPGFYLNSSSIPVKCTLQGCYQCISNTVCDVCSSVNNYIKDNTNNTCYCDSSKLFTQFPTAQACVCMAGYYLASNGSCQTIPLCPNNGSGCLNCTIGTPCACTLCDTSNNFQVDLLNSSYCSCKTGYYFTGSTCNACNLTLDPACTTCASSSVCLSCINNFTLFNGDCSCLPQYYAFNSTTCLACPIGCLSCDNQSLCLICDTANNFTMFSTICLCKNGLYLSGASCVPCGTMAGCLTCNTMGCTGCDNIFGFNLNTSTAICQCSFGNYINNMSVCAPCTQLGCLDCTSLSSCTTCDTSRFYLNNGTCDQICGDGVLYNLACDDGNLINGDGCSSSCNIQNDWTCIPGSLTSPSQCSYSGTVTIAIMSVIKDPSANKVYLKASIYPSLNSMANLDFNTVFIPQFPIQSSSVIFDSPSGNISMTFDYNQSLNNQPLSLSFKPPATPVFHYMSPVSVALPQTTDNNLALKVYDTSSYDLTPLINNLVLALAIAVTATFVIGFLFVSKLMAIQMVLIYQLTYCALMMILKLELFMVPLRNLWIVNGYNQLFEESSNKNLPGRVSEVYYKAQFLSNFSIDSLFFILPSIIGICYIIYGKVRINKSIRIQGYRIMKEWVFSALLFLQIHLNVSILLTFNFGLNKAIGCAVGAIIQIFLMTELILYLVRSKNFGQYIEFFQSGSLSQKWYLIVFVFRTVLAIIIGHFGENSFAFYAAIGLTVLFALFLMIARPYLSNVRPIVNSIFLIAIFAAYAYAKINQNSEAATFSTSYLSLMLIGLLFLALIFNIVCMIIYKVSKCKEQKENKIVNHVLQDNNIETKQMDVFYIQQIKQQLKNSLINRKNMTISNDQHNQLPNHSGIKEKIVRIDTPHDSARQRMNSETEEALEEMAL